MIWYDSTPPSSRTFFPDLGSREEWSDLSLYYDNHNHISYQLGSIWSLEHNLTYLEDCACVLKPIPFCFASLVGSTSYKSVDRSTASIFRDLKSQVKIIKPKPKEKSDRQLSSLFRVFLPQERLQCAPRISSNFLASLTGARSGEGSKKEWLFTFCNTWPIYNSWEVWFRSSIYIDRCPRMPSKNQVQPSCSVRPHQVTLQSPQCRNSFRPSPNASPSTLTFISLHHVRLRYRSQANG